MSLNMITVTNIYFGHVNNVNFDVICGEVIFKSTINENNTSFKLSTCFITFLFINCSIKLTNLTSQPFLLTTYGLVKGTSCIFSIFTHETFQKTCYPYKTAKSRWGFFKPLTQ